MVEQQRKISSAIVAGCVVLLITLLYFFIYPLYQPYFPKCIFHDLTGLYCPLCGAQRAINALLHGNLLSALKDNLLVVVTIVLTILLTAQSVFKFSIIKNDHKIIYSSSFLKAVLFLFIVFAILRNIPAYPFTLLAPL